MEEFLEPSPMTRKKQDLHGNIVEGASCLSQRWWAMCRSVHLMFAMDATVPDGVIEKQNIIN
uniref:Uncharacterized protein n=1 Tax=Salix viminalis TaxID=40686 RepID=A0A6N2NK89_SALVM